MIYPIILAGATASDIASSADMVPMHFEDATGVESRFQTVLSAVAAPEFQAPTVVTSGIFAEVAHTQMEATGITGQLLLEPGATKTAAGVIAALHSLRAAADSLVLILPADQDFDDANQLQDALAQGVLAAQQGDIVMLGVQTDRACRSHGYIECARSLVADGVTPVSKFLDQRSPAFDGWREQPAAKLWNTGIFLARLDTLLAAYKKHAARILMPSKTAVARGLQVDGILTLDAESYRRSRGIPFENAVLRHLDRLSVVELDAGWNELDAWQVEPEVASDAEWEAWLSGSVSGEAGWCKTLPHSRKVFADRPTATTHGGSDAATLAIWYGDQLREGGARTADQGAMESWGHSETLDMGAQHIVKHLTVLPGQSLPLSVATLGTHWRVVEGSAMISSQERVQMVWRDQSLTSGGEIQQIDNIGIRPLHLIEVAPARSAWMAERRILSGVA
ncbi:alginate biosynthesis protein [Phaeobacter gallaeciensis]|uniref:alginate biosynthesis protein n=1 Tax=Phaeobacter gallaeciensis TaxID=60890 RepID=UPI000BBB9565|nr:alginate biosynthesis protein [Phaeobacter gallaeciensis]ATF18075.1 Mannose-1-phosphate guanylyltransferase [Phaeobacter gallaeciensis]ATF22184.1 Mannose-1-phosphate guanylyltransferase [Phaeobacter gallaeciensis]